MLHMRTNLMSWATGLKSKATVCLMSQCKHIFSELSQAYIHLYQFKILDEIWGEVLIEFDNR